MGFQDFADSSSAGSSGIARYLTRPFVLRLLALPVSTSFSSPYTIAWWANPWPCLLRLRWISGAVIDSLLPLSNSSASS